MFNPAQPTSFLLLFAAIMLLLVVVEGAIARDRFPKQRDSREFRYSLAIALGHLLFRPLEAAALAVIFTLVARHAWLSLSSSSPYVWVAAFLATEFAYYWMHRLSHRIRWFWATHSVHHSSSEFTYASAVRLGWTGLFSGEWLFFVPLILIGFPPNMIAVILGANLVYQFFLHTELLPHLGPLEWVLNTPKHHLVHHASNMSCIDRNFGGILIIYDRILGSFADVPLDEELHFGLAGAASSPSVVGIALGEWGRIWADVQRARSFPALLKALFGTPS